jgi:predicted helicase
LAERQIAETTGRGIISYISNSSWLDGLSHPVMREGMLTAFDHIWIDNLNGGGMFHGSRGPDGKPDRSIFEYVGGQGSVGITVATAITTMIKTGNQVLNGDVNYRDLWGQGHEKRATLIQQASLSQQELRAQYRSLSPTIAGRFILKPGGTENAYESWPAIDELFIHLYPGVLTSRDIDLVSIDREPLKARMKRYFDPAISDAQLEEYAPSLAKDTNRYDSRATRRELLARSRFRDERIILLAYRPLDNRWVYWEPTTKLLDEKRVEFVEQLFDGNLFLEVVRRQRKSGVFDHGVVIPHFMDYNFVDGGGLFPTVRETNWFDVLRAASQLQG